METIKIELYPERDNRVTRTLMVQRRGIDGLGEGEVIQLSVTTPHTLPKDNDYREGPAYSDIDIGTLRFYGHVVRALREFRPSVAPWGWSIWPI